MRGVETAEESSDGDRTTRYGETTRRTALKAVAGAAALGSVSSLSMPVAQVSARSSDDPWEQAESPIEMTFSDVVSTADGPYAVGEAGNVAARVGDGVWELEVESGPSADSNPLTSVDVTDDGERIYFVGGSGAVGAYDVLEGKKHDYTGPTSEEADEGDDITSTWEAVAVSGTKDDEAVIAANGSGETLEAWRDEDDCLEWGAVTKPAGGSTIPDLDFASGDSFLCYGVDTSQEAFQTEDQNQSWENVGVENASEAFNGVTGDTEQVYVAAGGGVVYRLDCTCMNWTPVDVGTHDLLAVDHVSTDGETDAAVASAGEGYIYENTGDGWTEIETEATADLLGVTYTDGDSGVDVAVGSGGTIVERTV